MPKSFSSSPPTAGSMEACSPSSAEPSLRQALGESNLQNKPFPRPITKRQSQKFGQQTPSKGSFTPRSTRFHPASRPSTPSSAHRKSPGGSSPVPELDPFEKARVNNAWVDVQFKALARYPPPDVSLLSPSSTSPKLLTLYRDLKTWTAWLDACELKMENLQVVELPRMVASAKGPPPNVDIYHVILNILPLLKALRTQLLARRSWLDLLGITLEWEKTRSELTTALERGIGRGGGVWGLSPALSTLASLAHKSALLVKSSVELRATLSTEQVNMFMATVPKERDEVWWALKDGIQRERDASSSSMSAFSQTHQPHATYADLLFPPSAFFPSNTLYTSNGDSNSLLTSTSIPFLSPSGTSSSLNEDGTTASTAASLRSLSPSTTSSSLQLQLDGPFHTGDTLPRVIGWLGTEEQKRSWWEVSNLASSRAREEPFGSLLLAEVEE